MIGKDDSDLIFIIGRQRSGTTVFRQLLAKHGAMDADEILHGDLSRPHRFYAFVGERIKQDPSLVHPMKHPHLFRRYIKHLRALSNGKPIAIDLKYYAFNLIPAPGDLAARRPFIIRYIAETRANVFHISRLNKLRVFVSEKIASATGAWSAQHPHQLPPNKQPLELNVDEMFRGLEELSREDRVAREITAKLPKCHELVYEKMFQTNGNFADDVVAMVGKVLGVDNVNSTPTDMRMNPEPLSELIGNYDEIAEALRNTPFAWMLTE